MTLDQELLQGLLRSQPTHSKRYTPYGTFPRTAPTHCAATAKKKRSKTTLPQCIFAHLSNRRAEKNTLRTVHIPNPAPARSAVKRRFSVTTGHQAAQRSNHLHGKIEGRSPQVCCKSPLFLLHRARRSSFSPHPEKKKRGVHPQQRNCIPQRKENFVLKPQPRRCRGISERRPKGGFLARRCTFLFPRQRKKRWERPSLAGEPSPIPVTPEMP